MRKYILLTSKNWHKKLFDKLSQREGEEWRLIGDRAKFTFENISGFDPEKIFIPHWSDIIPENIFTNFECIVFHMTDLPFGKGGSPLQNLIVRGYKETMISALKVNQGLDSGDIYVKAPLSLEGTAQEIFIKSSYVVEGMIQDILSEELIPQPQQGSSELFKRRKPSEGSINKLSSIADVYDYIRMLDCEGYPPAFFESEGFRFEFTRAGWNADETLKADVRIIKK